MPRKRRGGKEHPPTMRMRVRAKNPQIGRRLSQSESKTVLGEADDAVSRTPVRVSALMDEDATEVVGGPPPIPRQDLVVRSAPRPAASAPASKTPVVVDPDVTRPVPQPKPRSAMILKGTKAAGALAAKVRVKNIEDAQTPTEVPELKLARAHLTRTEVERLEAALSGKQERRDLPSAASSPKRALERLIHADTYRELTVADRARLLKVIARDPRNVETTAAALQLVETGVVFRVDPRDRKTLLDVFAGLRGADRTDLALFAGRDLHGKSALFDRDFEDTVILDHLLAITNAKRLAPALESAGIRKKHVLAMLMSSLANPASLPLENAGDGVLGMFEFGLAECAPAELVRLWRTLCLDDMLAPLPDEGELDLGSVIRSQPGLTMSDTNTPVRIGLEQLVGLAHPRSRSFRTAFVMPGGDSLDADIIARALGYLYGVGFTVAAGATNANRQLQAASSDAHRVPPIFVSLLYEGGERLFIFDHVDADNVYVRSPHGASSKPKGGRRIEPLRLIEDPDSGLDSIPRDNFTDSVGVALVPRT